MYSFILHLKDKVKKLFVFWGLSLSYFQKFEV